MKYYCLGIKGAGMSTLANILYDLGNEVIGYDDVVDYKFTEEGLKKRNIKIYHDSSCNLDSDTIVTYSVALSIDHKELQRVRNMGLKIVKYNELLGNITAMFESICISGTHGKTTTSSLITHILKSNVDVNYFIGDGRGHAKRENRTFVIESDEFNKHFLSYHPEYAVITNIELEHTEIYKNLDEIIKTFSEFANKTKNTIVAYGDNENIRKIDFTKKVLYYGFSDNNDIIAKNIVLNKEGSAFDLYIANSYKGHFEVPLYGKHMVLNTLASIGICILKGIDIDTIKEALRTFKNAERRFTEERVEETIIIDDYAHHPTEIEATLEAARQKYPDKEIIAVFKPNTYSRTQKFYRQFASALNRANKAYLTEIDCNREKASDYANVSSKVILDLLKNGEMIDENTVDLLLKHKNNVICFMSCASISHMKEKLIELLKK